MVRISSNSSRILVRAGTLVDAHSVLHTPGAILLERHSVGWKVLAVGAPPKVERHPAASTANHVDQSGSVVCPALVNAHTHLDLTHIGPWHMPENGGFEHFIAKVRSSRRTDVDGIRESVRLGFAASRRGGVVAVGDIAGAAGGGPQLAPWREMRASGFRGTSYVEFFAIGNGEKRGIDAIRSAITQAIAEVPNADPLQRLGIHPHATYSVSIAGYREAIALHERLNLPICSHVAESPAEHEFIGTGGGALRAALEAIGIWDTMPEGVGSGKTPIERITSISGSKAIRVVHLNDISDSDIALLPAGSIAIYCPRSSAYFGAEKSFGPHRYRDLIRRGVKVALGTDSIVNLVDQAGDSPRISTWDEMRLLKRRDGVDERLLLRMATTWAAEAIELPSEHFELREGSIVLDLIGVQLPEGELGLAAALDGGSSPKLLLDQN